MPKWGELNWVLGNNYSWKGLSNMGTGHPGKWLIHHSGVFWRCVDVALRNRVGLDCSGLRARAHLKGWSSNLEDSMFPWQSCLLFNKHLLSYLFLELKILQFQKTWSWTNYSDFLTSISEIFLLNSSLIFCVNMLLFFLFKLGFLGFTSKCTVVHFYRNSRCKVWLYQKTLWPRKICNAFRVM